MMAYGYIIRNKEDRENYLEQKKSIDEYVAKHHLIFCRYIEDKIKGNRERSKEELKFLLKNLKEGDILVSSELTTLGRSFFMIMELLSICVARGIKVITVKDNFTVDDTYPKEQLIYAFSLCSEIERTLISVKTKKGLSKLQDQGHKLGRPSGSKNKHPIVEQKIDSINRYLAQGYSMREAARRTGIHVNTVYHYFRTHKEAKPPITE